jgi:hypothetical protein
MSLKLKASFFNDHGCKHRHRLLSPQNLASQVHLRGGAHHHGISAGQSRPTGGSEGGRHDGGHAFSLRSRPPGICGLQLSLTNLTARGVRLRVMSEVRWPNSCATHPCSLQVLHRKMHLCHAALARTRIENLAIRAAWAASQCVRLFAAERTPEVAQARGVQRSITQRGWWLLDRSSEADRLE